MCTIIEEKMFNLINITFVVIFLHSFTPNTIIKGCISILKLIFHDSANFIDI